MVEHIHGAKNKFVVVVRNGCSSSDSEKEGIRIINDGRSLRMRLNKLKAQKSK